VRGVVARKAFLGEAIDHRIAVGELEVRVQKTRRTPVSARCPRRALLAIAGFPPVCGSTE
jgi:hypothetical protein